MCHRRLALLVNPSIRTAALSNVRLRVKSRLLKKSKRDNNGREGIRESASTSASAKRDAGFGVEATLTDRGLHENASCANLRKMFFAEQEETTM